MSDEDFAESSGSEDFSASEDEWKPNNETESSSENGSAVSGDEASAGLGTSQFKTKASKGTKSRSKSSGQLLREKMFNKYRPPHIFNSTISNKNLSEILNASQFRKKKSISEQNTEESDSSGDDYLVDPKEIDLQSSFFDVKKSETADTPPNFDCNAGMRLSDSEDGDDANIEDCKVRKQDIPNSVVESNQEPLNTSLNHLHEYAMKLESAKERLKQFKKEPEKKEEEMNVSQLLAMGEGSEVIYTQKTSTQKRKKLHESDSEWEEVQDFNIDTIFNRENIEVTVQLHQDQNKEKKSVDMEAMLKRKLNRIIRENQLNFHKVSLLCHIAHGIYCNKAINHPSLMALALKLLPNKNCYPKERTDIKYFESMVNWYKKVIVVKKEEMYSHFRKLPPIPLSLALQIKYKEAICKKDFVLIFIVLLRAMDIQCRMVLNLVPLPIRPAQEDLCKISVKKDTGTTKTEKSAVKSQKEAGIKPNKYQISEPKTRSNVKTKRKSQEKETVDDSNADENASSTKKKRSGEQLHNNKGANKRNPNVDGETKRKRKNQEVKDTSCNGGNNSKKKKIGSEPSEHKTVAEKPQSENKNKGKSKEKSAQVKKPGRKTADVKPAKKLSKTLGTSKSTQKTYISPHFLKKDFNSNSASSMNEQKSPPVTRKLRSKKSTNTVCESVVPQLDGAEDTLEVKPRITRKKETKLKFPKKHPDPPSDSDEDFIITAPRKSRHESIGTIKKNKKVLSTDDDENDKSKKRNNKSMDIWVEVFCEMEDQWITIDLFKGKVHCVDEIRKSASSPIAYVFAWNNDNTLKDVSPRYCPQWNTTTRKQRVDQNWLNKAIRKYKGRKTARDKAEDKELEKIHMEKPLPTTISEYKNHPLYALKRHLLKFEGIYPPDAPTLGFVRGEPVYLRDCVHLLHSREIWLKQARTVKLGEKPYKIVKARPKWDKFTSTVIKDQPLELFGYWQTKEYEPPTAENGIVPRNAYGNVELFKKCMLPKKTVHLRLPGLNKICKKLKIDCAPAVIGFDFHQGVCHPLLDGFVVCEEYADMVVAAWYKEEEEAEKREEEKYLQRVYGNWKKLIKGLLIREKLKAKYNFQGMKYEEKSTKLKKSKK